MEFIGCRVLKNNKSKIKSLFSASMIMLFASSCGRAEVQSNPYIFPNQAVASPANSGIPDSPVVTTMAQLDQEIKSEDDNAQDLLFGYNFTQTKEPAKTHYLEMTSGPFFINKLFEPSALSFDSEGRLYTVADKGYYSVFELTKSSKGYNAKTSISMNKSQLLKLRFKKKKKYDFEGLEYNPNDGLFYIADERERKVLTVDRNGNINDWGIDVNAYLKTHKIKNSAENSGLEGLTLDPVGNKLYLIKEMNESAVIVVDLKTKQIERHFKINIPGKVEPSLTDASFFEGHLYVLIRSHRLIVKVDPQTGEILTTYDYRKHEENNKNVYVKIPTIGSGHDADGYGVMEGLAVTKDKFYVATDNNMIPLKTNYLKNSPQLFVFDRPDVVKE